MIIWWALYPKKKPILCKQLIQGVLKMTARHLNCLFGSLSNKNMFYSTTAYWKGPPLNCWAFHGPPPNEYNGSFDSFLNNNFLRAILMPVESSRTHAVWVGLWIIGARDIQQEMGGFYGPPSLQPFYNILPVTSGIPVYMSLICQKIIGCSWWGSFPRGSWGGGPIFVFQGGQGGIHPPGDWENWVAGQIKCVSGHKIAQNPLRQSKK